MLQCLRHWCLVAELYKSLTVIGKQTDHFLLFASTHWATHATDEVSQTTERRISQVVLRDGQAELTNTQSRVRRQS